MDNPYSISRESARESARDSYRPLWESSRLQMPRYLFDERGLRYKIQMTTIEYDFEEAKYKAVGTYAYDGSKIEWDGEPSEASDTPYQIKSPPWVEGLRMIKEGEKRWQQQRRATAKINALAQAKPGGQG